MEWLEERQEVMEEEEGRKEGGMEEETGETEDVEGRWQRRGGKGSASEGARRLQHRYKAKNGRQWERCSCRNNSKEHIPQKPQFSLAVIHSGQIPLRPFSISILSVSLAGLASIADHIDLARTLLNYRSTMLPNDRARVRRLGLHAGRMSVCS